MKFVGYVRVSTARQGRSGLGLQAQEAAINQHVLSRRGQLVQVFKEVESGKNDCKRPPTSPSLSF
ncbi:recombinase family protein [Pseudoxanthomonas mexicana]